MAGGGNKGSNFWCLWVLAQLLIAASLISCLTWIYTYLGGLGWATASYQFNWHPFCTMLGFIGCYSEAIMIFRVCDGWKKFTTKVVHAVLQISGIILASFGIFCVYAFHIRSSINNLYSLHSWLGQTTAACFLLQVLISVGSFLFPGASGSFRKTYLPIHIHFGMAMYAMVIVCIVSGITEKILFATSCSASDYPGVDIMGNITGVLVVLTGLVVSWLASSPDYKRKPLPEETPLASKPGDSPPAE